MTLAIILAYSVLLLLLALALLWSHWPRWLKALLAVSVTAFHFFGFGAVHGLLGVPSPDNLPERFVMLAAVVDEPTQKSAGSLYLWINPLIEGKALLAPRAYKLPYSRELHEQINDGIKKGRDGVSQMGTAEVKVGAGRGLGWLSPGNDEQEIKIRDLPVPQLPEK
jgi:hypothetical protein